MEKTLREPTPNGKYLFEMARNPAAPLDLDQKIELYRYLNAPWARGLAARTDNAQTIAELGRQIEAHADHHGAEGIAHFQRRLTQESKFTPAGAAVPLRLARALANRNQLDLNTFLTLCAQLHISNLSADEQATVMRLLKAEPASDTAEGLAARVRVMRQFSIQMTSPILHDLFAQGHLSLDTLLTIAPQIYKTDLTPDETQNVMRLLQAEKSANAADALALRVRLMKAFPTQLATNIFYEVISLAHSPGARPAWLDASFLPQFERELGTTPIGRGFFEYLDRIAPRPRPPEIEKALLDSEVRMLRGSPWISHRIMASEIPAETLVHSVQGEPSLLEDLAEQKSFPGLEYSEHFYSTVFLHGLHPIYWQNLPESDYYRFLARMLESAPRSSSRGPFRNPPSSGYLFHGWCGMMQQPRGLNIGMLTKDQWAQSDWALRPGAAEFVRVGLAQTEHVDQGDRAFIAGTAIESLNHSLGATLKPGQQAAADAMVDSLLSDPSVHWLIARYLFKDPRWAQNPRSGEWMHRLIAAQRADGDIVEHDLSVSEWTHHPQYSEFENELRRYGHVNHLLDARCLLQNLQHTL